MIFGTHAVDINTVVPFSLQANDSCGTEYNSRPTTAVPMIMSILDSVGINSIIC